MSRILIENFGPIEYFEEQVDDKLMILIGEQASGKSTIAKTVFFCKSISEELKKFLMDSNNLENGNNGTSLFTSFKKKLRTKFMEYFGTTKHMDSFLIRYTFDGEESVSIKLQKGYANIVFSQMIQEKCVNLLSEIKNYYVQQATNTFQQNIDLNLWAVQRDELAKMINIEVNKIFGQSYTSIFVPAGRSMLSTNSEFFHTLTPNKYDILMNEFIERIMILQKQYSQKLEDIIRDKKKMSSEDIDFQSVNKAQKLVKDILKGEYVNDRNGEKIYYSESKFVKLIQASSGQQEALWIVLLIFSIILNQQKVYLVIEEPEAHLFPTAQKEILELITLMINSTNSSVVITTHSPYILTSENLLMYSSHVEQKRKTETDIVPQCFRLPNETVSAYLLKNHNVIDIMDRDNCMIDAAQIDVVSEELNIAIDKLMELEIKNGLQ